FHSADVVDDSPAEDNKEKNVSLGEEDTKSVKTVAQPKTDEVESMDEPQPKTVSGGIGRRLRSRTSKSIPSVSATPAAAKKTKS
ncbi:hypothetical protein A2U01_0088289, partial [Trifolium medium]|nr:hypothetical protein [Trifolium medium]